jgi:hypothetical protein
MANTNHIHRMRDVCGRVPCANPPAVWVSMVISGSIRSMLPTSARITADVSSIRQDTIGERASAWMEQIRRKEKESGMLKLTLSRLQRHLRRLALLSNDLVREDVLALREEY